MIAALTSLFVLCAASPPSPSPRSGLVVVDREKNEIRFPFRFVRAAQAIEVFGCSPGGPTHETVVVFDAKGSEIARALASLGVHDERFWQVASADDFVLTQGDRLLILLRWEYCGRKREVPAEELLRRVGEDLPELIYGFSYTGRKAKIGDPPELRVPDVVEITVGGTGRQSAVTSIFVHPTAFEGFLAAYVSPLELNPLYAEEIEDLSEHDRGGTLIVRKVTETELLDYLLERKPASWGLQDVFRSQKEAARDIDRLKKSFVQIRSELQGLLGRGDPKLKSKVQEKLLEAGVTAWKISRAYLSMYRQAWEYERELLEGRLRVFKDHWRRGYEFLLNYAPERVKLAELRLKANREGMTEELSLRIRRAEERLAELKALREIPIWKNEVEFLTRRLAEAEKDESAYLRKMFKNDLWKNRIKLRRAELEAESHRLRVKDMDLRLAGKEEGRKELGLRLEAIRKEIGCLEIEFRLAETEEKIRWQEEELEATNPVRRERARKKLTELRKTREELKRKLRERTCRTVAPEALSE